MFGLAYVFPYENGFSTPRDKFKIFLFYVIDFENEEDMELGEEEEIAEEEEDELELEDGQIPGVRRPVIKRQIFTGNAQVATCVQQVS